jgi:hypothetical protein
VKSEYGAKGLDDEEGERLTGEEREALKREIDRRTRERLEAPPRPDQLEENRRLWAEAEAEEKEVADAALDYYRARRDAPALNPLPGDDGFLDFIVAAVHAGHIDTGEALGRKQHHDLILRAREARRT